MGNSYYNISYKHDNFRNLSFFMAIYASNRDIHNVLYQV